MYFGTGFAARIFKKEKSFYTYTGSKCTPPVRPYVPYIYVFACTYIDKPFNMLARGFKPNIPPGEIEYIQNIHLIFLSNEYIQVR